MSFWTLYHPEFAVLGIFSILYHLERHRSVERSILGMGTCEYEWIFGSLEEIHTWKLLELTRTYLNAMISVLETTLVVGYMGWLIDYFCETYCCTWDFNPRTDKYIWPNSWLSGRKSEAEKYARSDANLANLDNFWRDNGGTGDGPYWNCPIWMRI